MFKSLFGLRYSVSKIWVWCQYTYVEELVRVAVGNLDAVARVSVRLCLGLVREETHGDSEPDGQETQSCFCCIIIGLSCIKWGGMRVLQMG